MVWHYEKDGTPMGPVSEEEMQAARFSGEIAAHTRVWRAGWPDWRRASEVWPVAAYGTEGQDFTKACCDECGVSMPASELIRFDNMAVCETCKPRMLDKIRQGVTLGSGPWKDGKSLVTLKDTPLPDACFKCGKEPVKQLKKTLTWHHPAIYFAIIANIFIYLIIALCVRKTAKVSIPLCRQCHRKRQRRIALTWMGALSGIALFIGALQFSGDSPELTAAAFFTGLLLLLGSLLWQGLGQTVLARKIDKTHAWLGKCGQQVLDELPEWRG